jgi:hypothetical protein
MRGLNFFGRVRDMVGDVEVVRRGKVLEIIGGKDAPTSAT